MYVETKSLLYRTHIVLYRTHRHQVKKMIKSEMEDAHVYNIDQIYSLLNIKEEESLLNLYLCGSRVYGTATNTSDWYD